MMRDFGGYDGYSMSNRAVAAYEGGEKPKSKWSKEEMLETINWWLKDENARIVNPDLFKLPKSELFDVFFRRTSWHHTSRCYNETDFYSLDEHMLERLAIMPNETKEKEKQEEAQYILNRFKKEKEEEKEEKKAAMSLNMKRLKLEISYDEYVSGRYSSRGRWVFDEKVVKGYPDVRKKDGKIIGVEGRRLSSNNNYVKYFYLPPRCRKWREISRREAEDLGYQFA